MVLSINGGEKGGNKELGWRGQGRPGDWILVNKQRLQPLLGTSFVFHKKHTGHFIIWKASEIDYVLLQPGSPAKGL